MTEIEELRERVKKLEKEIGKPRCRVCGEVATGYVQILFFIKEYYCNDCFPNIP